MTPKMTPQEAINRIDLLIGGEKLFIKISTMGEISHSQNIEAFGIAIKALEKQIAKKVKKIKFTNGTINYGCPICKRKIISKVDGEFCGGTLDDYCNRCGQALDWSDEE